MTLWLPPKAPDEVVRREASWIGQLNGATIATNSLAVIDGTVTLSDVAVNDTADGIVFTVAGGLAHIAPHRRHGQELAVLKNVITTDDGRTLEMIIFQPVEAQTREDAPDGPSTALKGAILDIAFEQLSLAGYVFDQTPEERARALARLDGLMRQWQTGKNWDLGYNFPAVFGQGDENDAAGIPDYAVLAVAYSLARELAAAIGKPMPETTAAGLRLAMKDLQSVMAVRMRLGYREGTPMGQGRGPWSAQWPYSDPFAGRSIGKAF